ncbi:MAG: glycosyltransferase [Anaerolineales bacterium]|nr:glycosyltransferase [Anaerolineales bacterium]
MSPVLSVITSCYKGHQFLPAFLENLSSQTIFPQLELVFVHNDPTETEQEIIREFIQAHPWQVNYMEVPREPLGASWNRAWQAASAPLVGMWNMDDRRPSDSLERQISTLCDHPECSLTYGDYLEVPEYGIEAGKLIRTPKFSRNYFSRSFPQRGAFLVWRKEVADGLGYFDEQLLIGADFDLSLRMVAAGHSFCKTTGLVGYFTNSASGLSTSEGARPAAVERTVIQLRYAIYDKIRDEYLKDIKKFRTNEVRNFSEWIPLEKFLPRYRTYCQKRSYLKIFGGFRNTGRKLLKALGLLNLLYKIQKRIIRKDI